MLGEVDTKVLELSKGKAILIKMNNINDMEICQVGIIYTLADYACKLAADSNGLVNITLESTITYKKPITGKEEMLASAQVVDVSNRIIVCECVITVHHEIRAIMKCKLLRDIV